LRSLIIIKSHLRMRVKFACNTKKSVFWPRTHLWRQLIHWTAAGIGHTVNETREFKNMNFLPTLTKRGKYLAMPGANCVLNDRYQYLKSKWYHRCTLKINLWRRNWALKVKVIFIITKEMKAIITLFEEMLSCLWGLKKICK
jgi:hypothetical protein